MTGMKQGHIPPAIAKPTKNWAAIACRELKENNIDHGARSFAKIDNSKGAGGVPLTMLEGDLHEVQAKRKRIGKDWEEMAWEDTETVIGQQRSLSSIWLIRYFRYM